MSQLYESSILLKQHKNDNEQNSKHHTCNSSYKINALAVPIAEYSIGQNCFPYLYLKLFGELLPVFISVFSGVS